MCQWTLGNKFPKEAILILSALKIESIQSYLAICKQLEYGKTDINEEQDDV
jgi:hypothetical protein